ncbi:MAG TPA: response regulator [Blastocatellia bacterium]|nr:response regulator [Blastocatellia bacterium]
MTKPRVLIAEDNPDLREVYSFVLAEGGFEVKEASNGREAIESIKQEPPDVFITDIMMPEVTGVEIVKWLKAEANMDELPVIVISAYPDYLAKCYLTGATRVIRKPFDPHLLLDAVFFELSKKTEH